jgi:hypothetical protein
VGVSRQYSYAGITLICSYVLTLNVWLPYCHHFIGCFHSFSPQELCTVARLLQRLQWRRCHRRPDVHG